MNLTNKLQNFVKLGKDKYMFKIPKSQQKDSHKRFWKVFLSVLPEDSYFTDNNTTITFPATKVQTLHNFKKSRKINKSIRFLFLPETIGSIAYIKFNLNKLKENVIGGYTLTCIGAI